MRCPQPKVEHAIAGSPTASTPLVPLGPDPILEQTRWMSIVWYVNGANPSQRVARPPVEPRQHRSHERRSPERHRRYQRPPGPRARHRTIVGCSTRVTTPTTATRRRRTGRPTGRPRPSAAPTAFAGDRDHAVRQRTALDSSRKQTTSPTSIRAVGSRGARCRRLPGRIEGSMLAGPVQTAPPSPALVPRARAAPTLVFPVSRGAALRRRRPAVRRRGARRIAVLLQRVARHRSQNLLIRTPCTARVRQRCASTFLRASDSSQIRSSGRARTLPSESGSTGTANTSPSELTYSEPSPAVHTGRRAPAVAAPAGASTLRIAAASASEVAPKATPRSPPSFAWTSFGST